MVQFMLEKGAELENSSFDGFNPLHYAAFEGQSDIAKLLIGKGAHIEAKSGAHNYTPLHLASINGHDKVAEMLLNMGAKQEVTTREILFNSFCIYQILDKIPVRLPYYTSQRYNV